MRFAPVAAGDHAHRWVGADQGFVRRCTRRKFLAGAWLDDQRAFRRANPGLVNPNGRSVAKAPVRPAAEAAKNGLPGKNRPGARSSPRLQNRRDNSSNK